MKASAFPQTTRQDHALFIRSLRLIGVMAPHHAAAYVLLSVVGALLPAGSVWLLKRIIDLVAAASHTPVALATAGRTAFLLAGSYFLLVSLQQVIGALSRLLNGHLHDLVAGQVTLRLMEKASAFPDLTPFESPRFHDQLQLLQQEVSWRPMRLFTGITQGGQSGLTLLCMLFFLARFHPAVVLVLAAAAGPGIWGQRRLQQVAWQGLVEVIPLRRRLHYRAELLLTAPYAKEVRLFGFAGRILGRYREQFRELIGRVGHTRWRTAAASISLSLLAGLGVGGAFAYVIGQALRGAVTLGDLSLYTGALFQANGAATALTTALASVHEALPFMRELFAFLDRAPSVAAPTSGDEAATVWPLSQSSRAQTGFRLEGVSFRYPDTDRPVFENLALEIPWGRTTALVGENGAGKSTLVKLLTRLYDPTAGRVLLNEADLREYDLEDLRRHVAVVFQDFARYQMPVWENIGLGDVRHIDDRRRISEAARRAGADAVIRRLPGGEETMLGREFEGGVELSGGEWQKIALARAFIRDAPILILDEPTAALDARSEYEVYRRFLELAAGRTTLLISHRFSTVRMAERILVLEAGVVIEEGDHRGLVARGGRYAELYAMQAERYQ